MDVVVLKDLFIGIAAVLAAGLAIWNFLQSPSKQNAAAVAAMDKKLSEATTALNSVLAGHDRRIQHVENELRHLPDKDMVTELRVAIVELQGTVKSLDTQLSSVGRTVANIDVYLRKDDSK